MGGLYFWVCKMKPDSPALGCKCTIVTSNFLGSSHMLSLYRLGIYHRHDVDGYIRQLEVFIFPMLFLTCLSPYLYSVALYIASLIEIGQNISLTRVEIAAIAWGVNVASGIINTVGTKAIGHMSSFNLWWTIGGTLVLVITLFAKAPERVSSAIHMFTCANLHYSPRMQPHLYSPIMRSRSYVDASPLTHR